MSFDLKNYETVKERKKRFYSDFPDGRIIVEILNIESIESHALFKCNIYKNKEEQEKNFVWSTGFAHETRDMEKSISGTGKEYQSVNYSAWVENCEESAIGRALDNAGYAGNNTCSLEEMKKATRERNDFLECPLCKSKSLSKSKFERGGFYCFDKKGGCGSTFDSNFMIIKNKYNPKTKEEAQLFYDSFSEEIKSFLKLKMEQKEIKPQDLYNICENNSWNIIEIENYFNKQIKFDKIKIVMNDKNVPI